MSALALVPAGVAAAPALRRLHVTVSSDIPISDVEMAEEEIAAVRARHPDAALLTACAEHLRLAAEELRLLEVMRSFDLEDTSAPAEAAEQAWDAAVDRSSDALSALIKRQALTYDGAAAKARSALVFRRSIASPGDTDADLNLEDLAALSVLRDLEWLIGGVA
jgi:hypothetical protein